MIYPDMAAVEDALIELLAAEQRLADWQTEIIKLSAFVDSGWDQLFTSFPAVGTLCVSGSYEQARELGVIETSPLSIVCVGQSLSSPELARVGDDQSPGSLHLVEECRRVLEAWEPHENLQEITPTGWKLAWSNSSVSVCVLEAQILLVRPTRPRQGGLKAYGAI